MRLLKLQDDGSLQFTEDIATGIPPYAILSHTWGHDSQEVNFNDIREGTGRHKDGYQKIEFCCRQAVLDGLNHIWVDTCCIDKSNNTELSEAINSMFRWYQRAAKCYVYLSDVHKGEKGGGVDEPLRSTWKSAFRSSRWFTRGWTLQELIAPSSVEFFSADGERLGDKRSLEILVHDITGVAVNALRGSPMSEFGVEERILWLTRRQTKKAEDKAYSLLGLFDVYMPLLYGEGENGAFERLRREIGLRLDKQSLDRLPLAQGAAFDSRAEEHNPTCLQGTRVDVLREILEWADNPKAESIFWLNGMAGTGKSTISRTLARSFFDSGRLGASFFFKRGETDRGGVSKFFPTLAAQLVRQIPSLGVHVKKRIDDDPSIFNKALREQLKKLILEPLAEIPQYSQKTDSFVIIIDALDECEREEDISLMIHLLTCFNTSKSPQIRLLITSRPELPIRLGFSNAKGKYQDLILHEIPALTMEHDLWVFFTHELTKVRNNYNQLVSQDRQLPPDWPVQSDLQILVQMATPLFIFAATVCRFLTDRRTGDPDKKLRIVLERRTKSQQSQLDATYIPVLDQLLVDLSAVDRQQVLVLFGRVVGSIIVLANPVSVSTLASLVDIPQREIMNHLDYLHSVLSIPSSSSSSSPVRLLHLSFREFLIDPLKRNTNQFWVDEKETHRRLAIDCLRIMNTTLRTDICGITRPGTLFSSIDSQTVSNRLPPELRYACQYWIYHLKQAEERIYDSDVVHTFLQRHCLHWLEAMALSGVAFDSLQGIKTLRTLMQVQPRNRKKKATQLSLFLEDALRFILANVSIIQDAPLQVYCSALAFAPEKSVIRNTFYRDVPDWILLHPNVDTHWSVCEQTLEGHIIGVTSVEFSPDSRSIVSGSQDSMIRIWSADTGALQQTLEGHDDAVSSIAFSSDSKLVVSGSEDQTVRIWSVATGIVRHALEGHSNQVLSVAFSSDLRFVVSGSKDKTVRIWSVDTGALQTTLEGHSDWVWSVKFSPNSELAVTGSSDKTVRIWSVATGMLQQTLEGHSEAVISVAFSPNSKFLVSGSYDKTVRIWSADTGALQKTFEDYSDAVLSVAVSPDPRLVASGSNDCMLHIWSADTGALQQTLKGHNKCISSVAFSPDSTRIVSGSYDKTVRIWPTDMDVLQQTLDGHSGAVDSITCSSDSKLVASGSKDCTVRIWSANTGMLLKTFQASDAVRSLAFSSDSRLVASGGWDGTIQIWLVDTGMLQQTLKGHTSLVTSVAFSPSSKLVVSNSDSSDRWVRVWSVDTGSCLLSTRLFHLGFFVLQDADFLRFDAGEIPLQDMLSAYSIRQASGTVTTRTYSFYAEGTQPGYWISQDKCWVTLNKNKLIWLPVTFRPDIFPPGSFSTTGSTVAMGSPSGAVTIIRFSTDKLESLGLGMD
ncbi:vegetative incompatibility protein HET-E-1 [Xylariaceae sp. AK1471]|nr:vegetative incompatibility protein HET-E-1 [Xylariaceae sp. AK1471]